MKEFYIKDTEAAILKHLDDDELAELMRSIIVKLEGGEPTIVSYSVNIAFKFLVLSNKDI